MSPPPCQGGIASSSACLAVERRPCPTGPYILWRGEGVEVAVERAHVDAQVRRRLRAVHQHDRAVRVRHLDDALHRVDGAERVRDVGDGDDAACAGASRRSSSSSTISPRSSIGATRRRAPFSSHSICQGTMFEWCSSAGDQHLVAVPHVPAPVGLRHQVDRLGGAADEARSRGCRAAFDEALQPCRAPPRRRRWRACESVCTPRWTFA